MKKAFLELDLEVKVALEEDGDDTDDALRVEDRIAQELAEEEQDVAGNAGETTTVDRKLGRRSRTRPHGLHDYEWNGLDVDGPIGPRLPAGLNKVRTN